VTARRETPCVEGRCTTGGGGPQDGYDPSDPAASASRGLRHGVRGLCRGRSVSWVGTGSSYKASARLPPAPSLASQCSRRARCSPDCSASGSRTAGGAVRVALIAGVIALVGALGVRLGPHGRSGTRRRRDPRGGHRSDRAAGGERRWNKCRSGDVGEGVQLRRARRRCFGDRVHRARTRSAVRASARSSRWLWSRSCCRRRCGRGLRWRP